MSVQGTGTTFIQDAGTMSAGLAEMSDGSTIDSTGSGSADFLAIASVALTGDIQPGQRLDIRGTSGESGGTCSPVSSTVAATGSFTK